MTAPADSTSSTSFAFRAWVTSTCRKALIWGIGVLAVLGGVTWILRQPGSVPLGRAFGVLALYTALFLLTLLKIWWTARRAPAIVLTGSSLSYQLLHRFRPTSLPIAEVLSCGMRAGTESMRFVRQEPSGRTREFFLNLAVIDRRNEFLHLLGQRLEAAGLEPSTGPEKRWSRPGYEELFWGVQS